MIKTLWQAFRLGKTPRLALTGAGGKSTSLFRLAREYTGSLMLGTSAHLALEQSISADWHVIVGTPDDIPSQIKPGVTLFSGADNGKGRWSGIPAEFWPALLNLADSLSVPFLFEADGSHCLPVKGWKSYEPPIPPFVDTVVVCSGLSALGTPLDDEHVFRASIFGKLSGLPMGSLITPEALSTVLAHTQGGKKNCPPGARALCLLNQADTPQIQGQALAMAQTLLGSFSAVIISSLKPEADPAAAGVQKLGEPKFNGIHAVIEPAAGVVLAAGGASRMGQAKLLLPWRGEPLIRHSARAALQAGLNPVVVVTGSGAEEMTRALDGLAVKIVHNPHWQEGQSTSVKCGINALPPDTGSALFVLGDQPQIPATLMRALLEKHQQTLAPITCPLIGQQRANPVLFDRSTFADFSLLSGDSGARQIFNKYEMDYLPWHDQDLLLDVDTQEDFNRLNRI